eukprot:8467723-Pyramimonas_sp.AAC.2
MCIRDSHYGFKNDNSSPQLYSTQSRIGAEEPSTGSDRVTGAMFGELKHAVPWESICMAIAN